MAKKYYGEKKMSSKGFAGMPKETVQKSYPEKQYAVMEGKYVDTQPELDTANNRMVGKVRKSISKNY